MATVTADYKLFTPLQLGEDLTLKNRVVHGPITCARANLDHVPNKRNAVYYEQCAGAGSSPRKLSFESGVCLRTSVWPTISMLLRTLPWNFN